MLKDLIISARYKQWLKNIFIFAGIVFSKHFFEPAPLLLVIQAFIIFCATSSGIYIINDIFDRKLDKAHPQKRFRPIAAGRISITKAAIVSIILLVLSLTYAYTISNRFFFVVLSYVILQVLYSVLLKKLVIIDILAVSLGFVLRVVAGCIVIDVQISSWLILCTALLSLFIVISKRRQELVILNQNETRTVLKEYSVNFIDQMITILSASTITTYLLYAFSPETSAKFGSHKLGYSVPFVFYGLFRYIYLIYKRSLGEEPEKIVLTDLPFIVNFLCWLISIFYAIYT